jgi:hypothetical protein
MLLVIALSACAEASIIIFSFYWAPWIASAFSPAEGGDVAEETSTLGGVLDTSASADASGEVAATRFLAAGTVEAVAIPYILIYSTLMMSAMLGEYLLCPGRPHFSTARLACILHLFTLLRMCSITSFKWYYLMAESLTNHHC